MDAAALLLAVAAAVTLPFSLLLAPLLGLAYAGGAADRYGHSARTRGLGVATLACLWGVQLYQWLIPADAPPPDRWFVLVVAVQSILFHAFFLSALRAPEQRATRGEWLLGLAVPPLALGLPPQWALPLVFVSGCGWSLLLLRQLRVLRARSAWHGLERGMVAGFAAAALLAALFGVAVPWLGWTRFHQGYGFLLGSGFAAVLYLLLRFPELPGRLSEAARASYAQSTLQHVDRAALLARLKHLLEIERVYEQEDLSLAKLAALLALNSHQLSELVNRDCGMGFSQLLRQHRVAAAQRMLIDEPRASVLSIGLSVGFNSQSNFYAAFKESTGMNPGEYRRRQLGANSAQTPE